MSDFLKHSYENSRSNVGRESTYQARNGSTYNPISFNPEAQSNHNDIEKQRKKEKQMQYRDQLDKMVSESRDKKTNERVSRDNLRLPSSQKETEAERELKARREMEQKFAQASLDDQREYEDMNRKNLEAEAMYAQYAQYSQDQYNQPNDYENYYQMPDVDQKPKGGNNNIYEAYSNPIQEKRNYQPEVQAKKTEDASTFHNQDEQRDQLLNRMRNGYKRPNQEVYEIYQKIHEEKERNKQQLERDLVVKGAQEKLMREDQHSYSQWDHKKKMARDILLTNAKMSEDKQAQKKRQKDYDNALENQKLQDSLAQFEKASYAQKEIMRRAKEDTARVLEQQKKEFEYRRKNNNGLADVAGNVDSLEQLYNARNNSERNVQAPADPYTNISNPAYMDNPVGKRTQSQSQPYEGYLPKNNQKDYYPKVGENMDFQDNYRQQEILKEADNRDRRQDFSNNPYLKKYDGSAKSDYEKIRDRQRYGNSFNIISHE